MDGTTLIVFGLVYLGMLLGETRGSADGWRSTKGRRPRSRRVTLAIAAGWLWLVAR